MDADSNPYRASNAEFSEDSHSARLSPLVSLFMIVVGAFFCVASFYSILGGGVESLMVSYRTIGWFPFAFMTFYGVMSGFVTILHLSYLAIGRPTQSMAGMYAIAIGFVSAAVAVAVMESIA